MKVRPWPGDVPSADVSSRAVRVLVVDDAEDIRALVRASLTYDGRFEVLAEATNGQEAIELVSSLPVDVVLLDKDMPVLDGLSALPRLHEQAPGVAVVLYTAGSDRATRDAAVAAGAVDVVDKSAVGLALVERLAGALVSHWGDAGLHVVVGPVPSASALAWVANSAQILDAVVAHPEIAGERLDVDVAATFRELLGTWRALASSEATFYWTARPDPGTADRLVRAWAAMDRLSDEQIAALGCSWSPPEARVFFEALTGGIVEAMARHRQTRELAAWLGEKWRAPGDR